MSAVGGVLSAVADRNPVGRRDGDLIGSLLVAFAGLGAGPVVAGFGAVREQARALAGTAGEQAETVLALRRSLAGLLNALGLLVALATLALGAALQLSNRSESTQVVVLGAGLSVLVALGYAPAAGALHEGARSLCRTAVPLGDVSFADLSARIEDRHRLELALGVDRGLLADLQSGVIILAPLLASGAAAFLPG